MAQVLTQKTGGDIVYDQLDRDWEFRRLEIIK